MKKRNKDISELIGRLSSLGSYDANCDKGVDGMKEFPKILLEKSRQNIINKNYSQAKKDLKNYWTISKMLEESIDYKNHFLDHSYKVQRRIFNELASRGYFDDSDNKTRRAYE